MLAIIEDGFSTVSQVSYSDHKENSNAQKIEAEVSTSASILSKLLKIDLKVNCPILETVEKLKTQPKKKYTRMYLCYPNSEHSSQMRIS